RTTFVFFAKWKKMSFVIKHLHMKGLTPKEIKADLDNVHSTSAPAYITTVYNWMNEFKRDRIHPCDAPHSGRPIETAFNNILKKKRPHLAKKKVLFHQDNARVHTCLTPMAKFNEFRYELLLHPAYSPDLFHFLFSNLKKWFGGKRFEQLIAETEAYFEGDKSYYLDGLKKLENRWINCIELKGDYVEK
ncbi:SETMR methyltransferase, partial [Acromyrmex insinuator]